MPVVSEYHFAHQMWTRMFAVQGLRVMVPGDLVEVATRLLVPLYPNRAQPPWPSRRDTICAVIFCFALGGVIFPYWVRRNWMWPPAEAAASSDEPTASG